MDELKKIIGENREMFDTAEPSVGHLARFEQMLNEESKPLPKTSFAWSTLLKVASIAILIVLSGLYLKDQVQRIITPVANTKNSEFNEAEQYYVKLVSMQIGQIENMSQYMNEEQKKLFIEEMTEMDAMYLKLQTDLKAMPDDSRIVEAMLSHYQMKLDILNRIINDLKNVQQLKIPNHESIEI